MCLDLGFTWTDNDVYHYCGGCTKYYHDSLLFKHIFVRQGSPLCCHLWIFCVFAPRLATASFASSYFNDTPVNHATFVAYYLIHRAHLVYPLSSDSAFGEASIRPRTLSRVGVLGLLIVLDWAHRLMSQADFNHEKRCGQTDQLRYS